MASQQQPVLPGSSGAGTGRGAVRDPRARPQRAQPGQQQNRVEQVQADGQAQQPEQQEAEVQADVPAAQGGVGPEPQPEQQQAALVVGQADEAQAPAPAPDVAALIREMQELKKQVGALKSGRAADDLKEELVQYAARPEAAFDAHRALALVEALVSQARKEGHAKAKEYSIILDQISPLVSEPFFRHLVVNQFGCGIVKQVARDIAQFVKCQGNLSKGSTASKGKQPRAGPYSAKGKGAKSPRTARPGDRCFNCDKLGHFARDLEAVAARRIKASADSLMFRDPDSFRAGEIHKHPEEWNSILGQGQLPDMIRDWIENGVSIFHFMQPFKGRFKGLDYDCAFPPPRCFSNLPSCAPFAEFVSRAIEDRIVTGAVEIWGRVGKVPPPYLVLQLTVEPSKPRLCHDLRYLNLWMKDCPFSLDSVVNLTRYVEQGHYQTKCDDKSGYDHVLISEASKPLVGFQWGGFYYVSTTIPFGWSISGFIYQTLGNVAMHRIRELGVPSSLYIDDRHAGQLQTAAKELVRKRQEADYEAAQAACFILCSVIVALGYFIGISKSQLDPLQCLEFLGMESDSILTAFRLPERKKVSFAEHREGILSEDRVPVSRLQKITGKLVSFGLAVPATRLYCREMFHAISVAIKRKTDVRITGSVRKELEHWRFLDQWQGHIPWRSEKHESIRLFSDASGFRWGGSLVTEQGTTEFGDYWTGQEQANIIAVKETEALRRVLITAENKVRDKRVDALVDNTNLISAWNKKGGKSLQLSRAIRDLWEEVVRLNVDLNLTFTPSKENEADAPSRHIKPSDAMLHKKVFFRIETELGGEHGFDTDLMALPSNVQSSRLGQKLRFFSPYPTPHCDGVNVFSQDLSKRNAYVFPPFGLIGPLIKFVIQQKARVVMVVPKTFPLEYWWPIVERQATRKVQVACAGQPVLHFPTKRGGWQLKPTIWDLWAILFSESETD
ncbi:hypothetical protein Bbelb_284650 [Branchiostoma belcheri]|nr:hypothetical protein Bbelb_284650 [Branchiostoma belcheri]